MADGTNFSPITPFIGEFLVTEDTGSDQLIPDFTEKNRLLLFYLIIYIYTFHGNAYPNVLTVFRSNFAST